MRHTFLALLSLALVPAVQAQAYNADRYEITGAGIFALSQDKDKSCDMYGGMITFSQLINHSHELSISLGVMGGSDSHDYRDRHETYHLSTDTVSVPVILGYSYQIQATERLAVYFGVRGGFVSSSCDIKERGYMRGYGSYYGCVEESSTGPMAGAGIGIKYWLTDHWKLFLGYEYWKVWVDNLPARYMGTAEAEYLGVSTSSDPAYHVIKVGATYEF